MSLQEDVLDTIGDGIEVKALRERMANVGSQELDCCVNGLLRGRRITQSFGRYTVVPSTRPLGSMPHTGRPAAVSVVVEGKEAQAAPTAEQEAAASLQPEKRTCERCEVEKPLDADNFSRNRHGYMRICKVCYGHAVSAGNKGRCIPAKTVAALVKLADHDDSIAASGAESPEDSCTNEPSESRELRPNKSPQREGDNRDVSTERCRSAAAVPGTPGSYSRSDLSEDAQTPAGSGIASPALTNAQAVRQKALNRIALLEVDIANQHAVVERCDAFLVLYREFEGEGAA